MPDASHELPDGPAEPALDASERSPVPTTRGELRRARRPHHRVRHIILGVVAGVVAVTLIAVGVLLTKGEFVASKVFKKGTILDLVGAGTPLRTDGHGRTNVLLFGTSQDDGNHPGQWLTDSIQLVSINEKTKKVSMIAVPRDTWVHLPTSCVIGSTAKINAVYECAAGLTSTTGRTPPGYAAADPKGAAALMSTVAEVTGLTPQYWIHVDYSVLRDSVNALGGIDVNIVGDGHQGIYDTNLDNPGCTTTACARVYYPHNGVYHLDGQHAMDLARARADYSPRSYLDFGLDRGDFDREANQQKIMVAIKDKAMSAGTLANPVAIFDLLGALGDNVTMSFSVAEAKTLIDVARSVPSGQMTPISLTLGPPPVLTTGKAGGQDVVLPVAGLFDWSAVHSYIAGRLATTAATTPSPTAAAAAPPATAASG